MVEGTKYEIKSIPFQSTWDIRQAVMWPDKPIDYVKIPDDKQGQHLGLFVDGQLVSIVSVFISDNEAQFRKFATLDEHQGKGYGTKLLFHLFSELESQPLTSIWCNARINKTSFYERFGLRTTDHTYSKGGIEYVVMKKFF